MRPQNKLVFSGPDLYLGDAGPPCLQRHLSFIYLCVSYRGAPLAGARRPDWSFETASKLDFIHSVGITNEFHKAVDDAWL